jgi:hypothetical protein
MGLGQSQQRRADATPGGAASDIHRDAVLGVIDAMGREPELRRLAVHPSDCDEEGLAALHGLHVQRRGQTGAPSLHDFRRIDVLNGPNPMI